MLSFFISLNASSTLTHENWNVHPLVRWVIAIVLGYLSVINLKIAFNTRWDIFSAKRLTSSNSGIFRFLTRLEMAAKAKKAEHTEVFIDAWRREKCLWDVTSHHYKTNRKVSRLSWKDLRLYWDFIKDRRAVIANKLLWIKIKRISQILNIRWTQPVVLIIYMYFLFKSMLFSPRKVKKSVKISTKRWKVYVIFSNVFSRNQSCGNCDSHCN